MECEQIRPLLDAYVDGELEITRSLELEKHLTGCPSCHLRAVQLRELAKTLRENLPQHSAPAALKTRIHALIRGESAAKPRWWKTPLLVSQAATAFAVFLAAMLLVREFGEATRNEKLMDEAVINHTRSLMAGHLTDVASSDQHTVKPWFTGRLNFSPAVVDLGPSGYPLIGGRLDILDHQPVAALVYQRRKHYLNLFIWPGGGRDISGALHSQQGYQTEAWSKSGMNYLAVSELAEGEFREFVSLIREQTN